MGLNGVYRIDVLIADIDNGMPNDPEQCAVALAIQRTVGCIEVEVHYTSPQVHLGRRIMGGSLAAFFPREYIGFVSGAAQQGQFKASMSAFDYHAAGVPFSFELVVQRPGRQICSFSNPDGMYKEL
jgi:hypothetical protein